MDNNEGSDQKEGPPSTPVTHNQRRSFGSVMKATHDKIAKFIRRSNQGGEDISDEDDAIDMEGQQHYIVEENGSIEDTCNPVQERVESPIVDDIIIGDSVASSARGVDISANQSTNDNAPLSSMSCMYEFDDDQFLEFMTERERKETEKEVSKDRKADASVQTVAESSSINLQTDCVDASDRKVQFVLFSKESSTQISIVTKEASFKAATTNTCNAGVQNVVETENIGVQTEDVQMQAMEVQTEVQMQEMAVQTEVQMQDKRMQTVVQTDEMEVQTLVETNEMETVDETGSAGFLNEITTEDKGVQYEPVMPTTIAELFDFAYSNTASMEGFLTGLRLYENYRQNKYPGLGLPLHPLVHQLSIESALRAAYPVQPAPNGSQSFFESGASSYHDALSRSYQLALVQHLNHPFMNSNQQNSISHNQTTVQQQGSQMADIQQLFANQQRQMYDMNQLQSDNRTFQNQSEEFGGPPSGQLPYYNNTGSSNTFTSNAHQTPDFNFHPSQHENMDVPIVSNETPLQLDENRHTEMFQPEASNPPPDDRFDGGSRNELLFDYPVENNGPREQVNVTTLQIPLNFVPDLPENREDLVTPIVTPEPRDEEVQEAENHSEYVSTTGRQMRSCQVARMISAQSELNSRARDKKKRPAVTSLDSVTTDSSSPPRQRSRPGRPRAKTASAKSSSKKATTANNRSSSESDNEPSTSARTSQPSLRRRLERQLECDMNNLEPTNPIRRKKNAKDFRRCNYKK